MKRPTKLSETLLPAVLLVAAGFVFLDISRLPVPAMGDLVGAKIYPQVLAIALAVLAILILLGNAPTPQEDADITGAGMARRFVPLVVFSALYVVAFPLVGFLISTTGLLFACFYLLGERRHLLNLLIAAACAVGTYLLFAQFMGIQLAAFPV